MAPKNCCPGNNPLFRTIISDDVQGKLRTANANSANMFKLNVGAQGMGMGGSVKLGSLGLSLKASVANLKVGGGQILGLKKLMLLCLH